LFAIASLTACSDDPTETPDADAGVVNTDASGDTLGDVTNPDVEPDVVADTEPDAEPDAESDAEPDAEPDVEPDAEPDVSTPSTCESNDECDDGRDCTSDVCDEDLGYCIWEIAADTCLIGGNCYDDGTVASRNSCAMCDVASATTAWTPVAEGETCDSGDICSVNSICTAGECVGEALACEDGNPCTENTCVSGLGCDFPPAFDGETCDDGSACTEEDVCSAGTCGGATIACDDANPCTDDICDEDLGCTNSDNTIECENGDACTSNDVCAEGSCVPGGPTNCEDGNECTIDICDEFAGCVRIPNLNPCCTGTVSICDDGNPCTTDICNPEDGSCGEAFNTAACDDGDACTDGDICAEGACGGDEVDCAAENPCIAAFCDNEDGCGGDPLTGNACDDGVDCTVADACNAGVCEGVSECVCEPTFGLQAVKLTSLQIGSGGRPGQGIDLDGNPDTCSPSSDCSDGIQNALGVIAAFANAPLAEAVAGGSLMLVLDVDDVSLNPFEIAIFQSSLAPSNPDCDHTSEVCDYVVDRATLDPETCEPLVTLAATRAGDTVVAGGPGTVFPFAIPLGDAVLAITLYDVRFEGEITMAGGEITSLTGVIGGAVPRSDLIAALEALPADALPLDPASIISLLEILVVDDVDTDGDGVPDAASIGLPIVGIGAEVVGAL
jgi:hypothetical protein